MSIRRADELVAMKRVSGVVRDALSEMRRFARPGMSTGELDAFGESFLKARGARSAPAFTYGFPGWTCISVNHEIAHGIPSPQKILREGDLINIDVSAELDGYWADNGSSFVLGSDHFKLQPLVDASRAILDKAISEIRHGVRVNHVGSVIHDHAKKLGYKVIRNLTGHGIGRKLHEYPAEIPNFKDPLNRYVFQKNMVVAIETFISTSSSLACTQSDGWTLVGDRGGYVAQHEHTLVVTDGNPIILTSDEDFMT